MLPTATKRGEDQRQRVFKPVTGAIQPLLAPESALLLAIRISRVRSGAERGSFTTAVLPRFSVSKRRIAADC